MENITQSASQFVLYTKYS